MKDRYPINGEGGPLTRRDGKSLLTVRTGGGGPLSAFLFIFIFAFADEASSPKYRRSTPVQNIGEALAGLPP